MENICCMPGYDCPMGACNLEHCKAVKNAGITMLEVELLKGQYSGYFFVVDDTTRQHILTTSTLLRALLRR